MKRYLLIFLVSMTIFLIFQGCNVQKMLKDATGNITQTLKNDSKSIGDSLMLGVTNRLTMAIRDSLGTSLNKTLKKIIVEASFSADSAVEKLGNTSNRKVIAIRDSIFGEVITNRIQKLRDDLLGKKTKGKLDTLVLSAFNKIPKDILAEIVHNGVLKLAEDSVYLQKLSTTLIGPKTATGVQMIVDSAMNTLIRRYKNDLSPTIRGELSFFQKYTTQIIWVLIVGILAIIAFVWWQRRKYFAELNQLKQQQAPRNQIEQETVIDLIINRLNSSNQNENIEPLLQKLLTLQKQKITNK
jgi:hypothetical protein